ncbi:MAG: PrsW family intramembrane metalloprotease [Candidatus Pacebacteria bacterium]|nr:PrsW family intramembrane metalloprotease [Candidatus Paceibacterota bacterium]
MEPIHIILALAGGILPSALWLWYWTREDKLHPEPKRLLLLAFLVGGVTVAVSIPLEQLARTVLGGMITPEILVAWAGIEEALKYLAALTVILWRKAVNEPIDVLIYMITIALGFSAVENSLFLLNPIMTEGLLSTIITGNFRFFGATLLHLLSSSVVGAALAISFYKGVSTQITYAIVGVILATILHAAFNLFILNSASNSLIQIFAFVWLGIVVLLLFFEKVKKMPILPQR